LLHPPLILIISISRTHPVSTLFPYTTLFRSWNAEIAISLISRRSRALLTFSPTKRQRLPSSGNGYHPLRHLPSGSVSAFCLPIRHGRPSLPEKLLNRLGAFPGKTLACDPTPLDAQRVSAVVRQKRAVAIVFPHGRSGLAVNARVHVHDACLRCHGDSRLGNLRFRTEKSNELCVTTTVNPNAFPVREHQIPGSLRYRHGFPAVRHVSPILVAICDSGTSGIEPETI